jgi:hypothetical protein
LRFPYSPIRGFGKLKWANGGCWSLAYSQKPTMAGTRLEKTAREVLAEECIAKVYRVFPAQWLDTTLEVILDAAKSGDGTAQTAWKLLNDKRFKKR